MTVRSFRYATLLAIAALSATHCGSSDDQGGGDNGKDGGADTGKPIDGGGIGEGGPGTDGGGGHDATTGTDGGPSGPTEFATSFEPTDPALTWTSTVETDSSGKKKASGVSGSGSTAILGSVMSLVTNVSASAENPPNEIAKNVADGDLTTKWLAFAATGWVQVQLSQATIVKRYAVSSANDQPTRDPKNWQLQGSPDGTTWTTIDTQTNKTFASRFQTLQFDFANTTAYSYYRLNITANAGATITQFSELQLSDGSNTPPPASDMKSAVDTGPVSPLNAKAGVGYTGLHSLRYAGGLTGAGRGYSYNKLFDVNVQVAASSELSYVVMPDDEVGDTTDVSAYASIDLAFDDGTYLSDLTATDQSYAAMNPQGQGGSRTLYKNEWNYKIAKIGDVAAGKTIKRILVGYDNPAGTASAVFGGWIDDLRISGTPAFPAQSHLSDYVITTRGTNSSGGFSRGNNIPATGLPHGFNFWTPVTDASSNSWLYTFHGANNADNLPVLQALALSHEPSPWMGDRQTFQVMPSAATGAPNADRAGRGLPFRHTNETARPYYYGVTFENGIQAEIAPTDHAALFKFTFKGTDANLVFDNVDNNGGLTLDAGNHAISGYTDMRSGLSAGATRIFVYATFDKAVATSGMLPGGGGANVTGYFRFNVTAADPTVTMSVATSLISIDQAKKSLALEIAANDTFDTVKARAQKAWDDRLGIVQVEGANADQLQTLYSNLYRLYLYPNSGFENTGTAQAPVYKYASPISAATGGNTPTQTGAAVIGGKIYVNNGFWDTYRAAWPLLSLLTPTEAGTMIDGFAQQYRDGGWIARWSSPGYADLMTGTSSDVAFADAYVKGVTNFDAASVYDSAIRNATVPSSNGAVGRKGIDTSLFLGYTSTSMGAGLSWAMAGYLNDFGISNFATALAAASPADPRHQEYVENAEYFMNRAQNYVNLFDPSVGFFQGKTPAGAFALAPGAYDPRVWGYDYTETDGWNTAFDAPHDGQGLANLYGGQAGLATKLDTFFSTPETATFVGSYGGVIHEMLEAKAVRMGQLGLSNQPSFHIIYMYDFAGQPSKAQAKVRDALARLWQGSTIGQGYLGDEDNGAMSAWQVFGALGIYPLQVGSPTYVIGSPLFTKATIALENGKSIVINAPNNSAKNVYVQGLKVNGAAYTHTYLPHSTLSGGATLDFDMGPSPSTWGTGAQDSPPSITTDANVPKPLHDVTSGATSTASDGTNVTALFDNTSGTRASFTGANPSVVTHFAAAQKITFYTLTSGNTAADPTGWTLSGSNDGANYVTLDQRTGATFKWRSQTRAFKVATPGSYAYYRLALAGNAGTTLAEIELLTKP